MLDWLCFNSKNQSKIMLAFRNVATLILAAALLQIAGGLLGVIVPLALGDQNLSNGVIGIIAAIYSAGFMIGAANAPKVIRRIGNIRCFAFAAGIAAATTLIMAMFRDPYVWSIMRFAHGVSFALMLASDESWMTEVTPPEKRGAVLGIYHVAAKMALILGPFLATGNLPADLEPYMWCGIFMSLALIPICVTRRVQPDPPDASPFPFKRMVEVAPSAVIGVFVAGVSNTGFLSLLPIFAEKAESGSIAGTAAQLMAAAFLGGVISQFPAGYISDRIDRRIVIGIMGALSGVAALFLAILDGSPSSLLIQGLVALWGAGALSFYGLCVAHAADRCEPDKISRMMSGLLFVWAAGSVIGPILFGFIMSSPLETRGLFIAEIFMGFFLLVAMLWRRRAKAGVEDDERESYEFVNPTSLAGVEIDPRTDGTH